jgi:hypothetical protein
MWRLLRRKAEHLVLAGPFGRQIAEAGHSHATRESSFDRRLDEVRREEGERDRHVDIANAAPLSHRYTFNVQLGSAISSSSHRRPRAIDATKVARVSDLIGRARCGGIPTGRGGFAVWAQGRHQGSGLGDAPQVRDR